MTPLLREFFGIMEGAGISATDLAETTGISRSTFYSWRASRVPTAENLDVALRALGHKLKVVKINE